MTYDPQWKEKLEAKRAARGVASVPPVVPVAQGRGKGKTSVGQGCLLAGLLGFAGLVGIAACQERSGPVVVPQSQVSEKEREKVKAEWAAGKTKREAAEATTEWEAIRAKGEAERISQEQRREADRAMLASIQWVTVAQLEQGIEQGPAWEQAWVGKRFWLKGELEEIRVGVLGGYVVRLKSASGKLIDVKTSSAWKGWLADWKVGSEVRLEVIVQGLKTWGPEMQSFRVLSIY